MKKTLLTIIAALLTSTLALAGSGGVESGGCNYFPSICITGGGGGLLPNNSAATIGSQTLPWPTLYLSGTVKDGAGTTRLSFTSTTAGNTLVGSVTDAASAIGHKFGNANTLTSGTDRYIAAFYRDNLSTAQLYVTSNGSVVPANDGTPSLGTSALRFQWLYVNAGGIRDNELISRIFIGDDSGDTFLGDIADGASAVAHKFGNNNSLTSGVDRYIVEFYSDNLSTARIRIASNGSIIPGADNVASLGDIVNGTAFATVRAYDGRINSISPTSNPSSLTVNGRVTDAAAGVALKFGNVNSFTAGTDRYIAEFYSDQQSTIRLRVLSNGGLQFASTATLYDSSTVARFIFGGSTFNDYRATTADGAGNIQHRFRSTNAFTSGTDRYIAAFYSDDGSTVRVQFTSSGSIVATSNVQATAFTPTTATGVLTTGNTTLTLRGSASDGASAKGVTMGSFSTFANAGSKLVTITNGGTETAYIDKDGKFVSKGASGVAAFFTDSSDTALHLIGNDDDGATAVGLVLNNAVDLTTSGAKIVSFRTAAAEKSYVTKDGRFCESSGECYTTRYTWGGYLADTDTGAGSGPRAQAAHYPVNAGQVKRITFTSTLLGTDGSGTQNTLEVEGATSGEVCSVAVQCDSPVTTVTTGTCSGAFVAGEQLYVGWTGNGGAANLCNTHPQGNVVVEVYQ